jgi:hypothetical protein
MKKTAAALKAGHRGGRSALPASAKRFPDGAYRTQIPMPSRRPRRSRPSSRADKRKVPVHRASQGSGIMMLIDAELTSMLRISAMRRSSCRSSWAARGIRPATPQPFTPAGKIIGGSLRGGSQLVYAVEDVQRGCALGLRSVLVADLGSSWLLHGAQESGELPSNLVLKISILLPVPNPATAHVLESLGAGTINVSPDLSLGQLPPCGARSRRRSTSTSRCPTASAGTSDLRGAEMIRVASRLRQNGAPERADIYPYGEQLKTVAMAMTRERIHRARLVLDTIQRYYPRPRVEPGAAGLGIPEC